MTLSYSDAVILESNGKFGMVDSGEDSDFPDGSDSRYPLRSGTTLGQGHEDEVISYMRSIGVTADNFEFYIGTHPHSDHIGSADEVIRAFHPKRVYVPEYKDEYIADESRLWDNLYVYDRMIEAAREVGAEIIWELDPSVTFDDLSSGNVLVDDDCNQVLDDGLVVDGEGVLGDSAGELRPSDSVSGLSEEEPGGIVGSPRFMLGDMVVDIVNYDDSYKTAFVRDADWFAWGVKVSAHEQTAFLSSDIGNSDGDEDRLAAEMGSIGILKLGHHGSADANTLPYLEALSPDYAVLTAPYGDLPSDRVATLDAIGAALYSSSSNASKGYGAIVFSLSSEGVFASVYPGLIVESRDDTPRKTAYENGMKTNLDGWVREGDDWYWFEASPYASEGSWKYYGGSWYFLGTDAAMATGWARDGDTWYYFDASGRMQSNGWLYYGGSWYWLEADGAMRTGWLWSGGHWYWLDPESGAMAAGWFKVGDDWYCADSSGRMLSGGWFHMGGSWYWLDDSGVMARHWCLLGGNWYWFGELGSMATGWIHDGLSWYYMEPSGAMTSPGWHFLGSSWYYMNADGSMRTGWLHEGGWYWLDVKTGAMATGWAYDGSNWYHFRNSGLMDSGGWLLSGGSWYWLEPSGAMATGWLDVGGSRFWLDEKSGAMCVGLREIEGKTYCFDSSGAMVRNGWVSLSSSEVGLAGPDGSIRAYSGYMDGSGVHLELLSGLHGWQDFEGQTVYVKQDGALATNWLLSDGAWYWLSEVGFKQYGWLLVDGKWYWLDKDSGAMATGWIHLDDGWYWLDSSGAMATGWIYINGSAYKLDQSGRWVEDTGSVLNVSRKRLVEWLWSHEGDGYYIGTPYSSGFSIPTCTYPNGAPRRDGFVGMNCTGMVVHAYSMAGGIGDLGAIGSSQLYSPWLGGPGGGSYINAWRWYGYAMEHGAEVYTFDSVASMLASGKAEKGDIIFFKTNGSIDCHIGFFWGNTPYENKMWHQIYPYNLISTCFNNANKNELYQQTVLIKGC